MSNEKKTVDLEKLDPEYVKMCEELLLATAERLQAERGISRSEAIQAAVDEEAMKSTGFTLGRSMSKSAGGASLFHTGRIRSRIVDEGMEPFEHPGQGFGQVARKFIADAARARGLDSAKFKSLLDEAA